MIRAALELLIILAAAGAMFVPAVRHPEWRGGLMALGFVFLAAAANEIEPLWEGLMRGWIEEPELIPIALALLAAIVCALCWRGTFVSSAFAIYRNRRFPLLVWGLVFVSLMPNVAKDKEVWAFFAPGVEASHDVREFAEEATRFVGHLLLLNWAVLFLKDKFRRTPLRQSPLAALLREHELIEIGRGTRRVAYRVGDTGYCVKFYYPQEQCNVSRKMQKSIQRELKWRRFNKARNSSSAEVHVYNRFRHVLPPEIRAKLPEVCVRVFHPRWGWGVLETYYTNPDGTAIIPYEREVARQTDPAVKAEIYRQARDLLLLLIEHRAFFHEPGNFHVLLGEDGSVELKLIDFEPESKTAIPLEMFVPALRARKLRRKAQRYLTHIRKRYQVDVPVETEVG
ncbi:MAG: hypothetical protein ACI4R9_07430 [Kiritimatiellia bacterium]